MEMSILSVSTGRVILQEEKKIRGWYRSKSQDKGKVPSLR